MCCDWLFQVPALTWAKINPFSPKLLFGLGVSSQQQKRKQSRKNLPFPGCRSWHNPPSLQIRDGRKLPESQSCHSPCFPGTQFSQGLMGVEIQPPVCFFLPQALHVCSWFFLDVVPLNTFPLQLCLLLGCPHHYRPRLCSGLHDDLPEMGGFCTTGAYIFYSSGGWRLSCGRAGSGMADYWFLIAFWQKGREGVLQGFLILFVRDPPLLCRSFPKASCPNNMNFGNTDIQPIVFSHWSPPSQIYFCTLKLHFIIQKKPPVVLTIPSINLKVLSKSNVMGRIIQWYSARP